MSNLAAFRRSIKITLSNSQGNRFIIDLSDPSINQLKVSIELHKYMSALKDEGTINITNLDYIYVTSIINQKIYDCKIEVGYGGYLNEVFDGAISYISMAVNSERENVTTISLRSKVVAKFMQNRINLTLNSGINTYAAIKYILRASGIAQNDSNIDKQYKQSVLNFASTINKNQGYWIEQLIEQNDSLVTAIGNSGSSDTSTLRIYDASKNLPNPIKISSNYILAQGYPTANSQGVNLSVIPYRNFNVGDVIQIDKSLVNISGELSGALQAFGTSAEELMKTDQSYMILDIELSINNREGSFIYKFNCKRTDLISSLFGYGGINE